MHIKLFRALVAAKVSEDAAAEVVEAVEEYIAVKVQEANKSLEAQQRATNWLIGSLGTIIAIGVLISAVSPVISKLIH